MFYKELARRIKERDPKYANIPDLELVQRVIENVPAYADQIRFQPTPEERKREIKRKADIREANVITSDTQQIMANSTRDYVNKKARKEGAAFEGEYRNLVRQKALETGDYEEESLYRGAPAEARGYVRDRKIRTIRDQRRHQESKIKDIVDAFYLGARNLWHSTKQWFTGALPQFVDATVGLPDEWEDSLREKHALAQKKYNTWIQENPQLQPRKEWEGSVIENIKKDPGLLMDPAYWGFLAAESTAFSIAVMGTAMGAAAALPVTGTAATIVGILAGTAVATPMQTEELYQDLRKNGADEDKAGLLAGVIGPMIAGVESAGEMWKLNQLTPDFFKTMIRARASKAAAKKIAKGVAKMSTKEMIKNMATTGLMISGGESLEEVIQESMQNATVATVNENRKIFENLPEIAIRTFMSTLPYAALGIGGEYANAKHTNKAYSVIQRIERARDEINKRDDITDENKKIWGEKLDKDIEKVVSTTDIDIKMMKEYMEGIKPGLSIEKVNDNQDPDAFRTEFSYIAKLTKEDWAQLRKDEEAGIDIDITKIDSGADAHAQGAALKIIKPGDELDAGRAYFVTLHNPFYVKDIKKFNRRVSEYIKENFAAEALAETQVPRIEKAALSGIQGIKREIRKGTVSPTEMQIYLEEQVDIAKRLNKLAKSQTDKLITFQNILSQLDENDVVAKQILEGERSEKEYKKVIRWLESVDEAEYRSIAGEAQISRRKATRLRREAATEMLKREGYDGIVAETSPIAFDNAEIRVSKEKFWFTPSGKNRQAYLHKLGDIPILPLGGRWLVSKGFNEKKDKDNLKKDVRKFGKDILRRLEPTEEGVPATPILSDEEFIEHYGKDILRVEAYEKAKRELEDMFYLSEKTNGDIIGAIENSFSRGTLKMLSKYSEINVGVKHIAARRSHKKGENGVPEGKKFVGTTEYRKIQPDIVEDRYKRLREKHKDKAAIKTVREAREIAKEIKETPYREKVKEKAKKEKKAEIGIIEKGNKDLGLLTVKELNNYIKLTRLTDNTSAPLNTNPDYKKAKKYVKQKMIEEARSFAERKAGREPMRVPPEHRIYESAEITGISTTGFTLLQKVHNMLKEKNRKATKKDAREWVEEELINITRQKGRGFVKVSGIEKLFNFVFTAKIGDKDIEDFKPNSNEIKKLKTRKGISLLYTPEELNDLLNAMFKEKNIQSERRSKRKSIKALKEKEKSLGKKYPITKVFKEITGEKHKSYGDYTASQLKAVVNFLTEERVAQNSERTYIETEKEEKMLKSLFEEVQEKGGNFKDAWEELLDLELNFERERPGYYKYIRYAKDYDKLQRDAMKRALKEGYPKYDHETRNAISSKMANRIIQKWVKKRTLLLKEKALTDTLNNPSMSGLNNVYALIETYREGSEKRERQREELKKSDKLPRLSALKNLPDLINYLSGVIAPNDKAYSIVLQEFEEAIRDTIKNPEQELKHIKKIFAEKSGYKTTKKRGAASEAFKKLIIATKELNENEELRVLSEKYGLHLINPGVKTKEGKDVFPVPEGFDTESDIAKLVETIIEANTKWEAEIRAQKWYNLWLLKQEVATSINLWKNKKAKDIIAEFNSYSAKDCQKLLEEISAADEIYIKDGMDGVVEYFKDKGWGTKAKGYLISDTIQSGEPDRKTVEYTGRNSATRAAVAQTGPISFKKITSTILEKYLGIAKDHHYFKVLGPAVEQLYMKLEDMKERGVISVGIYNQLTKGTKSWLQSYVREARGEGISGPGGNIIQTGIMAGTRVAMVAMLSAKPAKWVRNAGQRLLMAPRPTDVMKAVVNPDYRYDSLPEATKDYFDEKIDIREQLLTQFFGGAEDIINAFKKIPGGKTAIKIFKFIEEKSLYLKIDANSRKVIFATTYANIRDNLQGIDWEDNEAVLKALGKTTFAKMDNEDKKQLIGILKTKGLEEFARRVGRWSVENSQWIYSRALKGIEEHGPGGRTIWNVFTWSKNYLGRLGRDIEIITTSTKASLKGGHSRYMPMEVKRATMDIMWLGTGAMVGGMAIATFLGKDNPEPDKTTAKILERLLDGEDVSPTEIFNMIHKGNGYTFLGQATYSIGGLGFGLVRQLNQVVWHTVSGYVFGNKKDRNKLPYEISASANALLPLYEQSFDVIEAFFGRRNIDMQGLRYLQSLIDKEYSKPDNSKYEIERIWWQKIQKAVFSSEKGITKHAKRKMEREKIDAMQSLLGKTGPSDYRARLQTSLQARSARQPRTAREAVRARLRH